jgi:vacuolar protein sorting-associated protein 13A/C
LKGGEVFYRSMKSGVKNIYDLPQQGASREGFAGFLKGMGKGVVGALAAPLIGTLGGISRVTDTTAYFDKPKVFRRRRAARMAPENQALPLLELRDVGEEGEEGHEEDEKQQALNKQREGPTET